MRWMQGRGGCDKKESVECREGNGGAEECFWERGLHLHQLPTLVTPSCDLNLGFIWITFFLTSSISFSFLYPNGKMLISASFILISASFSPWPFYYLLIPLSLVECIEVFCICILLILVFSQYSTTSSLLSCLEELLIGSSKAQAHLKTK